jgi:hypothetical protein
MRDRWRMEVGSRICKSSNTVSDEHSWSRLSMHGVIKVIFTFVLSSLNHKINLLVHL